MGWILLVVLIWHLSHLAVQRGVGKAWVGGCSVAPTQLGWERGFDPAPTQPVVGRGYGTLQAAAQDVGCETLAVGKGSCINSPASLMPNFLTGEELRGPDVMAVWPTFALWAGG